MRIILISFMFSLISFSSSAQDLNRAERINVRISIIIDKIYNLTEQENIINQVMNRVSRKSVQAEHLSSRMGDIAGANGWNQINNEASRLASLCLSIQFYSTSEDSKTEVTIAQIQEILGAA